MRLWDSNETRRPEAEAEAEKQEGREGLRLRQGTRRKSTPNMKLR